MPLFTLAIIKNTVEREKKKNKEREAKKEEDKSIIEDIKNANEVVEISEKFKNVRDMI